MTAVNFKSAHMVRAVSFRGKVGIFGGDEDPITANTISYPIGSFYLQANGDAWKRVGADESAWVKLTSEEMILLNIGMGIGADGFTHMFEMAGQKNQELMVRDDQVIQLLHALLMEQKKVNGYLSLITGENLDADLQGDE